MMYLSLKMIIISNINFHFYKNITKQNFTTIPIEALQCVCVFMKIDKQIHTRISVN